MYLIGIDEVGRGPLAGPVTVCACMIRRSDRARLQKLCVGIKDSKKLSVGAREAWLSKINLWKKDGLVSYAVTSISNTQIDKKGIAIAIKNALRVSLTKLKVNPKECHVLLDGSLYAPLEYKKQKTIIKGDEKEFIISLASIVAKVHRDAFMSKISKKFPYFGFEIHKGYGTQAHRDAIKKYGISSIHRATFCHLT